MKKNNHRYRGLKPIVWYGDRYSTNMWNHRGWQKKKRSDKQIAKRKEKQTLAEEAQVEI